METNLNNKKRHGGSVFPYIYFFGQKGFPRYNCFPPHTARDSVKVFKFSMLRCFSQVSSFHLYDIDFSACHLRVVTLFITEERGKYLYDSIKKNDLWMEITYETKINNPFLRFFPIIVLRKVVKTKALAMLNGAVLTTEDHIKGLLKNKTDEKGVPLLSYLNGLCQVLATLPIILEFHQHAKFIYSNKRVFLLHLEKPVSPVKNQAVKTINQSIESSGSHTLNSKVFTSIESVAMSYLIEFLICKFKNVIPLVTQHDGVIIASLSELTQPDIEDLNEQYKGFLGKEFNLDLPVEVEKIGE